MIMSHGGAIGLYAAKFLVVFFAAGSSKHDFAVQCYCL